MITLLRGDCLELMKELPDNSVDMILCDLPYGTTEHDWDSVIPFEPLWAEYKRIIKKFSPIVLFAQEPFASYLRLSNISEYKYEWIWRKTRCGNVMNSKNSPLKIFENILVFSNGCIGNGSKKRMPYNPQGCVRVEKQITRTEDCSLYHFGRAKRKKCSKTFVQEFSNLPKNILEFRSVQHPCHPTEKPTDLLEYLIKTYTNEGETVIDNTMGSGSTGVACVNTNRNFIGIEKNERYFEVAKKRIEEVKVRKGGVGAY